MNNTEFNKLGKECFDHLKEINPKGGIEEFIRMAVEFGYKKGEDLTYSVKVRKRENADSLDINFYADCGKHGICEMLDSYKLTPKELLDLLQKHYDTDNTL